MATPLPLPKCGQYYRERDNRFVYLITEVTKDRVGYLLTNQFSQDKTQNIFEGWTPSHTLRTTWRTCIKGGFIMLAEGGL